MHETSSTVYNFARSPSPSRFQSIFSERWKGATLVRKPVGSVVSFEPTQLPRWASDDYFRPRSNIGLKSSQIIRRLDQDRVEDKR